MDTQAKLMELHRILNKNKEGISKDVRMKHHPVAILEDRYNGAYSKGSFLCISEHTSHDLGIANTDEVNNQGMWSRYDYLIGYARSEDLEAEEFWKNPPNWVAVGNTPDEALLNLYGATS